jgi:hypothetical protein
LVRVAVAVAGDLRARRIPNRLMLLGAFAAALLHGFAWVSPGLSSARESLLHGLAGLAVGALILLPGYLLGRTGGGVQLCVDQAGPHAVDANALGGHFAGQANGERVGAALACRVVDPLAGTAQRGCPRRNVDDRAATATARGRHPPDRLARGDEIADQIEVEDRSQRLDVDVGHPAKRPGATRIVDEDVGCAERAVTLIEELQHPCLGGHVGLDRQRASADRHGRFDDLLRTRGVVGVAEADRVAVSYREQHGGGADAAAAAGDDHHVCAGGPGLGVR